MASLNRNGIIISCGNFSRKLPWIPIAVLNVSFKDVEYRFCGFPIVSLDCQVNQVMVMGKTQQDTSQNLASSNHNCDFPPNQKKNRATLQGRRTAAGRRQAYPRSTCCIQLPRRIGKNPKYLDELWWTYVFWMRACFLVGNIILDVLISGITFYYAWILLIDIPLFFPSNANNS